MERTTLEMAPRTLTARLLALLEAQAASDQSRLALPEWPYRGLATFVLAEGKPFYSLELGSSERRFARSVAAAHWRVHGPFLHREPALNSQRCLLLDRERRLTYVEGFVLDQRAGYAAFHSWLALDGRVVDFTAASPKEPPGSSEPPQVLGASSRRAYAGVRFRREYVEQRARATGGLGPLVDDWERGFPLLRTHESGWREV